MNFGHKGNAPVDVTQIINLLQASVSRDSGRLAELVSTGSGDFAEQSRLLQAIQAGQRAIAIVQDDQRRQDGIDEPEQEVLPKRAVEVDMGALESELMSQPGEIKTIGDTKQSGGSLSVLQRAMRRTDGLPASA